MNATSFMPDWISAPGRTIASVLNQQELSVEEFARAIGWSRERATTLIEGRRSITPAVAKSLSETIGGTQEFWLAREQQYRDDIARLQSQGSSAAATAWLSELPLADMVRSGWVRSEGTAVAQSQACLDFFGVADVSAWRRDYGPILSAVAFRTSPSFSSEPGAVLTWLRYGQLQAERITCGRWNKDAFRTVLPQLRKLTRNREPQSFIPKLRDACARVGVAIVIARTPNGCHASGATQFLSSQKAMMILSFRHLTDDQFWFTFFHEAGHLVLHDRKALFIEDKSEATSSEEDEANAFAQDILVSRDQLALLSELPLNRQSILQFAVKAGVSRGIVVGQLQHMRRLKQTQFNHLKRRFSLDGITSNP